MPALIAGVAAVAPKIYDVATEPTAALGYSVTTSPDLPGTSGVRRIVAITIKNIGKRPLSAVKGELVVDPGQIEAFKLKDPANIGAASNPDQHRVSVTVEKLLPGVLLHSLR